MSAETEKPAKKQRHLRVILIMGLIFIGLGLFGLICDPGKELIVTAQLTIGVIGIIYVIINRVQLKQNRNTLAALIKARVSWRVGVDSIVAWGR